MRDEVWIKHDARSRIDPKMSLLIKREGQLGYGVFWSLVEVLHYQNDHELDLSEELEGVANQLQIDVQTLVRIIDSIVECKLFVRDGDVIFQARLKQDQAARSTKVSATSATKCHSGRIGGLVAAAKRRGAKPEEIEAIKSSVQAGAIAGVAYALDKKEERENTGSATAVAPVASLLHPSPSAPKQLIRKKTELKPYPREGGPVWITQELYDGLCQLWGQSETDYLIQCLADWSTEDATKFRKRKDHGKTLKKWREMKHSDGKEFFDHPQLGPNYYKRYEIEKWKTTLQSH